VDFGLTRERGWSAIKIFNFANSAHVIAPQERKQSAARLARREPLNSGASEAFAVLAKTSRRSLWRRPLAD